MLILEENKFFFIEKMNFTGLGQGQDISSTVRLRTHFWHLKLWGFVVNIS